MLSATSITRHKGVRKERGIGDVIIVAIVADFMNECKVLHFRRARSPTTHPKINCAHHMDERINNRSQTNDIHQWLQVRIV